MIFKAKKIPQPGDRELITKFALWPRRCYNGHRHWLEYVQYYRVFVYAWGWDNEKVLCDSSQEEKHEKVAK